MAITKNHTIDATLKKAVAYITDPDKTDGTLLISSFASTPETSDIEFEWTRQYAIDKGDYKHAHVNKRWYYNTRRISDRLCLEYGLSVIEPNKNKGKSYSEYTADKNGLSWKSQLRLAIDRAVRRADLTIPPPS